MRAEGRSSITSSCNDRMMSNRPAQAGQADQSLRGPSVVVRLAGEDLVGPEQLLQQHHPGKLVGQRHRPERHPLVGLEVEPLRPADHEAEVAPVHAALLEPLAELLGAALPPVAREQHGEGALRDARQHLLVLADLHLVDLHVAREHLPVVLDVVLVGRPQPPHGYQGDPHRAAILRACPRTPSAISTFTPTPRRWRATTPTSPTSPTRTTSSRSRSPASTTRSRRARCPVSWSRG